MKREKCKTFILLFLILSAFVLTLCVWFGSGIWPRGYDFFVTLPNRAFFSQLFRKEETYISPMENLSKPQRLVVTNGSCRGAFYNSDEKYADFFAIIRDFYRETLANGESVIKRTEVNESEWYDVLRNDALLDTKSVYFDYNTSFSPGLFGKICGSGKTFIGEDTDAVREFILAPVSAEDDYILFYVRGARDGRILKYYVTYPGSAALYEKIDAMTENENASFAFELNLHDSNIGIGMGVVQKVVMDPLILISPRETESVAIRGENPLSGDTETEELLSRFGYSAHQTGRYTGTDGTVHFIENYGAIHIYPDGLLEYYVLDGKNGVNILPDGGDAASLYDALNGAVRFSADVWRALVPDQPFEALVTSDILENAGGTYDFTLDYYLEGTPITIDIPAGLHEEMKHAVEIRVSDGRIVRYRHYIRRFDAGEEKAANAPMLRAIDGIYAALSEEDAPLRVTELFLSYTEDTGEEEKRPMWCARIEGREGLYRFAI